MSRLIVVSNRVVVPTKGTEASAGGLSVAIHAALRRYKGLWFGWSGNTSENVDGQVRLAKLGNATVATIDISEEDRDEYYNGFANRTLWPLFHYRTDLTAYDRRFDKGYFRVNANFAESLSPLLEDDDLIWVHDYHLIPLGAELRRRGHAQRIGFFLHIPFPAPEILLTMSNHQSMVASMFAYDLVGFQTESDLRSFIDYVLHEAGGSQESDGRVTAYGKTIQAGVFPIGLDTPQFLKMATSQEAVKYHDRFLHSLSGRHAIIGVDRLDYSKGLQERLLAFEMLLSSQEKLRSDILMLQISPPSRLGVPEYEEMRHELNSISGRINGRFADFDKIPIRYVNQGYSRSALAGLYRASRVGLVTPLRDGMNLVAKEYIAAQDPEDPGVLVLSRFAGAARQFSTALIVNPYNHEEVVDAMVRALSMPLKERKQRWQEAYNCVVDEDVFSWRDNFVDRLRGEEAQLSAA